MPHHDQRLRTQIEESVGGLANLWNLVAAIREYVVGEITKGELSLRIRRLWPRAG